METIRQRLFAALQAIAARLLLPPGASARDQEAAIRDAYALAIDALGLRNVYDTDASAQLEAELEELPD